MLRLYKEAERIMIPGFLQLWWGDRYSMDVFIRLVHDRIKILEIWSQRRVRQYSILTQKRLRIAVDFQRVGLICE